VPSCTAYAMELWNIEPVQFVVEDVRQTPIELPFTSGGGS